MWRHLANPESTVDFSALAAEIDRIARRPNSRQVGRLPYNTELMVRVLILQQLYGVSDEVHEYQLLDRLLFQRFFSLRYSSSIPDARTIWVYRERVQKAGGANVLFDAVQHQLQHHGFLARGGQIIDTLLVEACTQYLWKDEIKNVKQGQIPTDWTIAKQRQKDTDASWTKKHGKSHLGYKSSASVDRKHKFIRKRHISSAKEHNTHRIETVLDPANTSRDAWLGKGYHEREQRLTKEGMAFTDPAHST